MPTIRLAEKERKKKKTISEVVMRKKARKLQQSAPHCSCGL
jgi:hypothetical protein